MLPKRAEGIHCAHLLPVGSRTEGPDASTVKKVFHEASRKATNPFHPFLPGRQASKRINQPGLQGWGRPNPAPATDMPACLLVRDNATDRRTDRSTHLIGFACLNATWILRGTISILRGTISILRGTTSILRGTTSILRGTTSHLFIGREERQRDQTIRFLIISGRQNRLQSIEIVFLKRTKFQGHIFKGPHQVGRHPQVPFAGL